MLLLLWAVHLILRVRYSKGTNYVHDLAEFFFATLAFAVQGMAFIFSVVGLDMARCCIWRTLRPIMATWLCCL